MERIEWKMIFHANINFKKAGEALLISDKVDGRTKKSLRIERDIT